MGSVLSLPACAFGKIQGALCVALFCWTSIGEPSQSDGGDLLRETRGQGPHFHDRKLVIVLVDWCCSHHFVRHSLVALLEAPCAQMYLWDVDFWSICRNRTGDLVTDSPALWPTKLFLYHLGCKFSVCYFWFFLLFDWRGVGLSQHAKNQLNSCH